MGWIDSSIVVVSLCLMAFVAVVIMLTLMDIEPENDPNFVVSEIEEWEDF